MPDSPLPPASHLERIEGNRAVFADGSSVALPAGLTSRPVRDGTTWHVWGENAVAGELSGVAIAAGTPKQAVEHALGDLAARAGR